MHLDPPLDDYAEIFLPTIETELQFALAQPDPSSPEIERLVSHGIPDLREMLSYHMGWTGAGAGPESRGKRIRPMLVALCAAAAGGDWHTALPAAAAVELVHNFSLIHDDIQDRSELRHGRPALWKTWGAAQAINAGDLMFTLANLSILRSNRFYPAAVTLDAAVCLLSACDDLTRGQTLDLGYETCQEITLEDYWPMVEGKTAALLGACTEIGGILGGASSEQRAAYRRFGRTLGLAFQAKDDFLGVWGDSALTGKSSESDLLNRKKSLPVLLALQKSDAFARRWAEGPISQADIPGVVAMLEEEGAFQSTIDVCNQLTGEALAALDLTASPGKASRALLELTNRLLNRNS